LRNTVPRFSLLRRVESIELRPKRVGNSHKHGIVGAISPAFLVDALVCGAPPPTFDGSCFSFRSTCTGS
jgi:hypothetical protein